MSVTAPDTSSRRSIGFTPMETNWRLLVDAAVHAEEAGYETIVIPEGWGLDASIVLSEIARNTSHIRIASGILSIWGRTPATLAMTAATLDDLSDGRFTLGLGASTPVLAEQFHATSFTRPAERLASTVRNTRLLLDGDRCLNAEGQPGLKLGMPARPDVPIWVAGFGPRAMATAITSAEGWFPVMIPRTELNAFARAADPDGQSQCELVTGPMAFIANSDHNGKPAAEQLIGWYLTGMGTVYGDFVAANGFPNEVAALRERNPKPRPGKIEWPAEADALLGELTVYGDASEISQQLSWWDSRSDVVAITTGPTSPEDLHSLIDACAPGAPMS